MQDCTLHTKFQHSHIYGRRHHREQY